jgi:hypothetical protein
MPTTGADNAEAGGAISWPLRTTEPSALAPIGLATIPMKTDPCDVPTSDVEVISATLQTPAMTAVNRIGLLSPPDMRVPTPPSFHDRTIYAYG